MTPETRDAALEGLRFEVKALKPGQRVGYWKLMDAFDGGDPMLSRALDAELERLAASGEISFVQDEEGAESIVKRRSPASVVTPKKKKTAARVTKKKQPKKKSKAKAKPRRKK